VQELKPTKISQVRKSRALCGAIITRIEPSAAKNCALH
jgi:hypothetical protein